MQLFFALLLGKTIQFLTQRLKLGGGSAAPGLYALKVDPHLVEKLAGSVPKTVVITGTNGKTTTARMLAHFAHKQGLKVIRNATGSNLERGIASSLLQAYHFPGGKANNFNLAVWELDEAAFSSLAPKLKPNIVVFLNIFRDQLDRYGEIDSLVRRWCETLKKLDKNCLVLVNGDDKNLHQLKGCFGGEVKTFGVESHKIAGEKAAYQTNQPGIDFEAKNVRLRGLSGSQFSLFKCQLSISVPGLYHVYDALAASVCASSLGIPPDAIAQALLSYKPAFGRVEQFALSSKQTGYIFLIKNPTGATQVFQTLSSEIKPQDRLLLALNDNLADGTDVSWIWDAEFEKLKVKSEKLKVVASGSRAEDLAVRLKYAGLNPGRIIVEKDLKKALEAAKGGLKGRLFILPTYTALLQLQKILARQGVKGHYWEEV